MTFRSLYTLGLLGLLSVAGCATPRDRIQNEQMPGLLLYSNEELAVGVGGGGPAKASEGLEGMVHVGYGIWTMGAGVSVRRYDSELDPPNYDPNKEVIGHGAYIGFSIPLGKRKKVSDSFSLDLNE